MSEPCTWNVNVSEPHSGNVNVSEPHSGNVMLSLMAMPTTQGSHVLLYLTVRIQSRPFSRCYAPSGVRFPSSESRVVSILS